MLNSNELGILLWKSVHFETEFYGFTYPTIKLIQGLRLSMATGQRWHRISLVQFYRVAPGFDILSPDRYV